MKSLEYWVVSFTKGDKDPLHKYLFETQKEAIKFKNSMKSEGYIASVKKNEEFV